MSAVATGDTASWVGNRIRQTRERSALSQGELARRLHKTQTAVSYWESGKRSPGLDVLLDLARIFDKDVAWFLPRTEARRSLQEALRATTQRLGLHGLAEDLERVVDTIRNHALPEPELEVDSDRPVEAAREMLAKAALAGPPVGVEALGRRCGVTTTRASLDAAIAGALIVLDDGAVIAINEPPPAGRGQFDISRELTQRFFVAHQLGHYLLGHCDHVYLHFNSTIENGDPPGYDWRHERDANDFAAELLMPATFVKIAAGEEEFVEPLAERFRVSPLAMAYRLINLGLR